MEQHRLHNKVFSFLGAPGSGKGTLARKCEDELGFNVLSTGDLCRKNIAECTGLGRQVKELIDAGRLIPDDLVTTMVQEWLDRKLPSDRPLVLDGYPRTVGQFKLFNELRKKPEYDFRFRLILFEVSDDEIVKRLINRLICSNNDCQAIYSMVAYPPKNEGVCDYCGSSLTRRNDDTEDVVRARLRRFSRYKEAILSYCHSVGIEPEVLDVSNRPIDQVFENFKQML